MARGPESLIPSGIVFQSLRPAVAKLLTFKHDFTSFRAPQVQWHCSEIVSLLWVYTLAVGS